MKLEQGNLWDKHNDGFWVCIPTNGVVREDQTLVMGKGVALDAAKRYPTLAAKWGAYVREHGNEPCVYISGRFISFPTKQNWREPASLQLIENSARILLALRPVIREIYTSCGPDLVYLPKVGCGNGGLDWEQQVLPLLSSILDDTFVALI